MSIAAQWRAAVRSALDAIDAAERSALAAAARLLADSLTAGGVLQTFGTGHSRAVAMEFVARAGGLAAANQLGIRDLAYYGDRPIATLLDPLIERESGLAAQIWSLARIEPPDVLVIISNSGRNAAVLEMAELAAHGGHPVIAITSRTGDGGRVPPLAQRADVVIDTHVPAGDAAVTTPWGPACGLSTLCGVHVAQSLVAYTLDELAARNADAQLLTSSNLAGGDEANTPLRHRYGDRVRWGDA